MNDSSRRLVEAFVANGMSDLGRAAMSIGLDATSAERMISEPATLEYLQDVWEACGRDNPQPQHMLPKREWELFANEYATGADLHDAYRKSHPGVRASVVPYKAQALVQMPRVAARIQYLLRRSVADYEVTAHRIKREIFKVALSDPRRLMREDGTGFKRLDELDDDIAAAVSQYKVDQYGVVHVKLHSKNEMLKLAAQHFKIVGMEDAADELANALAEKLNRARARARAAAPATPTEPPDNV